MQNILELKPIIIDWIYAQERIIQESGFELNEAGVRLARTVGVSYPEKIKVMLIDEIPQIDNVKIRSLAKSLGMLRQPALGMTFGHSIYIANGKGSTRLYSHEFRHVFQCEQYPTLADYASEYISQLLEFGYHRAPLEIDARESEITKL